MSRRRLTLAVIAATATLGGGIAVPASAGTPPGVRVIRDVAYGPQAAERFDVYAPAHAKNAPVVFMVHGGGWRRGDKAADGVVQNKVARWVPRGFVVISTNYPMLPDAQPLEQARSVGKALAYAQRHAARFGAGSSRFVLMGHSAGAHLVSLLAAKPSLATAQGAKPWLGTIALDSAAYDVAAIMQGPHFGLYDTAFGDDGPAGWAEVSPTTQLRSRIAPFLGVCSSLRSDSCPAAEAFVAKARALGSRAAVLPEPLRHGLINADLGLPGPYTARVETFLRSLAPALARLLPQG